jgi:hypothetical protein
MKGDDIDVECNRHGREEKLIQNINVAIFWDIAPCSPPVIRRFGGTYHLHVQG